METVKNKNRNSNIELLRILMILSIILHHSFVHSGISSSYVNSINFNIFYGLQSLGKIANNVFIIITGYYMVNKKIKIKSIIRLFLETIFYSYIILFFYLLFEREKNIKIILMSIFPILSNLNWFITAYLLLYISIPIINIVISNLNEKKLTYVIIFLIILFSILPTFNLLNRYYSNYIYFILLYLIGAYFKLYNNNIKELYDHNILILLTSSIAFVFYIFFIKSMHYYYEIGINNCLAFMTSVSIFISFIKMKEKNIKIINYISSSVLGVYLIHDNIIVRPILWKFININSYLGKKYFWIYEIGITLCIFFVCVFIDKIRQYAIERPIFKLIDKYASNKKEEEKCHV